MNEVKSRWRLAPMLFVSSFLVLLGALSLWGYCSFRLSQLSINRQYSRVPEFVLDFFGRTAEYRSHDHVHNHRHLGRIADDIFTELQGQSLYVIIATSCILAISFLLDSVACKTAIFAFARAIRDAVKETFLVFKHLVDVVIDTVRK
jgi:hypothetical protein